MKVVICPQQTTVHAALQGVHHVKEQDELGKRRAAEERWDFENREINKKLSAVKSSGSRD